MSLPAILAINVLWCALISLVLFVFVPSIAANGFTNTFVHSQAIGNCVALLIVGAHRLLGLYGRRSLRVRFAVVPVAIVAGFFVGSALARTILGLPSTDPGGVFNDRWVLTGSLLTTVIGSVIGAGFVVTRDEVGRLQVAAAEEARRAEAAQRQASEAKLAMLRAQVEPHMLFNTLSTLHALVPADPARARELLERLVEFLRATLDGSRTNRSTLADECEVLDHYLALMQIRLGDRLAYRFDVSPALGVLAVPSLLLQPLVENAIRHGIEPDERGGSIEISAQRTSGPGGATLVIQVRDSGVGCRPHIPHGHGKEREQQQHPYRTLGRTDDRHGFGLAGLRERLAVLAGSAASLEIESPPPDGGRGTLVTVRLPAREHD